MPEPTQQNAENAKPFNGMNPIEYLMQLAHVHNQQMYLFELYLNGMSKHLPVKLETFETFEKRIYAESKLNNGDLEKCDTSVRTASGIIV